MSNEDNALEVIAKQNEGITLGLSALAEQLQKMNAHQERLVKQEEEDAEAAVAAEEEEEEVINWEKMIKSVTAAVENSVSRKLTKLEKQVQELGSDGENSVGGTKISGSASDDAKEATIDTDTEESQTPIAAMRKSKLKKQDIEGMPIEEEEDDIEMGDDEDEEYSDSEIANMARMIKNLRKELKSLKKDDNDEDTEEIIQDEVEKRLRKSGWREERGLASLKLIQGTTEVPTISKSESGNEVVDQLSEMSWSDLLELREKVNNGDPSVPSEFIDMRS